MRVGPDGGSFYVPPPTAQELQGQVTTAQTNVTQDQSRVHAAQGSLSQAWSQDGVRVQQVVHLDSEVNTWQARLTADQATLTQGQAAVNKLLAAQLPSQTSQAIKSYGAAVSHTPGAPDVQTATSTLQSATFNEEVWVYEQNHGGQGAAPGSTQWQQDAQNLLNSNDPGALQTARDVVAAQHLGDLPGGGLDLQHFGAQEWAGEAVAKAELRDPQSADGSLGKPATLAQQVPGEQAAARSLSDSLAALPSDPSGIDPTLARAALLGNGYVSTLAHEITGTMQGISGSKNQTSADGLGFLYNTVRSLDPALATVIIRAAAPLLQQYLKDQSGASTDQASQAYVFTAGLYDVLLNAQQAGVLGASALAGQLAQWSYTAADASNGNPDKLLAQVQSKTLAQNVPANLLHAWEGLSQTALDTGEGMNNVAAWGRFQRSVDGNAQLKAQPLTSTSAPCTVVAGLSPDQVHASYDAAFGLLSGQQQNGNLPAGVNPLALAAVQTQMTGGYGAAGDQVALARAMIADQQPQLNAAWLKQHSSEQVLMPVNDLTSQASTAVLGLGDKIGLGGKSWSDAVGQALKGMEAPLPTAPSSTTIDATNTAYDKLQQAQASGNPSAIAVAQQGFNEALTQELRSVYGTQFAGNTLISDNENADWSYLAEVQVMRDHNSSTALIQQVSAGLQASAIIDLSLGGGRDAQHSVIALDEQLAPLQAAGADPGGAITQAVLHDARVQGLINTQVSAATSGTAADPTTALTQEAQVLGPYERSDANGVVAQQIITGTIGSALTQQILANANGAAVRGYNALGTAAPLMQAAQLSPSLTLAVYQAFDLPSASAAPGSSSQAPSNALIVQAAELHGAADYRNLAIIYAALPDDVRTVGVPTQLAQAQTAKAALLGALVNQLNQPKSTAAQNIKSWIQASFSGTSSAPAWLASDLLTGYLYRQGGQMNAVGGLALGNEDVVSSIQGALYQPTGGSSNPSASAGSTVVDMAAAASADGTTLQQFSSEDALTGYVAQAYGLRPTSGAGAGATYDPQASVDGNITLGQIIAGLKRQAGVTSVDTAHPLVLQAAPVTIGESQGAEFRVQRRDGSTVWLGADGSVTTGWAAQDTALTHNLSTTAIQVVGGVTEADVNGSANPLLKIDTPPPPPPVQHPWWESVAKDAIAVTAGLVTLAVTDNPYLAFVAAFSVQQLFDAATNDGAETVFQYASDAVHNRLSWKVTKKFAVDTGTEAISAAADVLAPEAAKFVAGKVTGTVVVAAAGDTAATLTTAGTETAVTATTTAGTDTAATAATAGTALSRPAIIGRRVLAATAASATQSTIQTGASLANTVITHGWGALGDAASQQGWNLLLAIPAGGISGGLLPGNILVQTAAGFATSVGQTKFVDAITHQKFTSHDLLTALINVVPITAQHYADRLGGLDMIKPAFTWGGDTHPQSSAPSKSDTSPDPGMTAAPPGQGANPPLPPEASPETPPVPATAVEKGNAEGQPVTLEGSPRVASPTSAASEAVSKTASAANGQSLGATDWLSVFLNTLSGTAIHKMTAGNSPTTAAELPVAPARASESLSPGNTGHFTVPAEPDVWPVTDVGQRPPRKTVSLTVDGQQVEATVLARLGDRNFVPSKSDISGTDLASDNLTHYRVVKDEGSGRYYVLPNIRGAALPAPASTSKKPVVPSIPAVRASIAQANGDTVSTPSNPSLLTSWLPGARNRFQPGELGLLLLSVALAPRLERLGAGGLLGSMSLVLRPKLRLSDAGYSPEVSTELAKLLDVMPRRQAISTAEMLTTFYQSNKTKLDDFLAAVNPANPANPTPHAAYDAGLILHLASLSASDLSLVFSNAGSLDNTAAAGQPAPNQAFTTFLLDTPANYDPTTNARRTTFLLSFPDTARADVSEILGKLEALEAPALLNAAAQLPAPAPSPSQPRDQRGLVDSLTALAAANNVPASLAKYTDRNVPISSLQAVTDGMPLSGVRRFDFASNYAGGAAALKDLIDTIIGATPKDQTPALNLMFETGTRAKVPAPVGGKTQIEASAYGPVGTALLIRDLKAAMGAVKAYQGVDLTMTVVADSEAVPVMNAVIQSLGLQDDVTVTPAASNAAGRTALLDHYQPDAVLSIGQSSNNGGRASLLEAAGNRTGPNSREDVPTFAVVDGTSATDYGKVSHATYSLGAWNADLGAQALSGVLLRELGAGQRRSLIPGRHVDAGLGRLMHGPTEVRKAYTAALANGAIFDDSRLAPGSSNGTLTVDAHVGNWYLLNYALAPRAPVTVENPSLFPSWRADFTASYQAKSTGTALTNYNEHFENARPPEVRGKLNDRLKYFQHQLSVASRGEQFRTVAGASLDVGAMGFLGTMGILSAAGRTHNVTLEDWAAVVAAGGTGIRQVQILKMTGIKQWKTLFRRSQDPNNPADVAKTSRRGLKSTRTRALTYGTTAAAIGEGLSQALFTKQGIDWLNVGGGLAFLAGIGAIQVVHFRNLVRSIVRPDGKFYAAPEDADDPKLKDLSFWSRIIHIGEKGGALVAFGSGSVVVMFDDYVWFGVAGGRAHAALSSPADIATDVRSTGNVFGALGAVFEIPKYQLIPQPQWDKIRAEAKLNGIVLPEKPQARRWYAFYDLLNTYVSAGGIEAGGVVTVDGDWPVLKDSL